MRYLFIKEEEAAKKCLNLAGEIAKKSTCKRAKCGSIIEKEKEIIGRGCNSPPGNKETQRRCSFDKGKYDRKVTDKTCCIHAEQRAIADALQKNPEKLQGSRIYFVRLDEKDSIQKAGKPYCTICSKLSLDLGIKEFVLWHEQGIAVHNTEEYNLLSFEYKE